MTSATGITITDIITLSASALLIWRGFSRGFLRSLLGPLALLIATLMSITYYQVTQNTLVSLLIGLIGPIVLQILFNLSLRSWTAFTNPDAKLTPVSRAIGAVLTFLWGWVFIVMTLLLLDMVPPLVGAIEVMHKDMRRSLSYAVIRPLRHSIIPEAKQHPINATRALPADNADVQALAQDPRFQNLMNDPEIQKAIEAKDFAKLLSNPKMMELTQQLMSDPEMMKKMLTAYSQMQNQPANSK